VADAVWLSRNNSWAGVIAAENHYSLLEREAERDIIPACQRFGLGVLPYFPLANGLLSGKYHRETDPPTTARLAGRTRLLADAPWDRIEKLRAFAEERGVPMATVAIGWLAAQKPVGSVIAGATTPEQVTANAAATQWHPTPDDLLALDEICPPGRR
jgi:aryl-alcohol dehydrogenase-like predicted oxidoreductase